MQLRAVDQLDVSASRKCRRFVSESARGHNHTACGPVRSHQTVKLADNIDADLERSPLLALNEELLHALHEHKIDSPVCPATVALRNAIALEPKAFTDELLELLPAHAVEHVCRTALGHVSDESLRSFRRHAETAAPAAQISGTMYWPTPAKLRHIDWVTVVPMSPGCEPTVTGCTAQ